MPDIVARKDGAGQPLILTVGPDRALPASLADDGWTLDEDTSAVDALAEIGGASSGSRPSPSPQGEPKAD